MKVKNVNTVLSRLKQYANVSSDAELARKLEVGRSRVYMWRQRSVIDFTLVAQKFGHLNTNWALTGEGSMYSDKQALKDYETGLERVQNDNTTGLLREGSPAYQWPPQNGITPAIGTAMCKEGILEGDILYYDDKREPKEGDLVLTDKDGYPAVEHYKPGDAPIYGILTRFQRKLTKKRPGKSEFSTTTCRKPEKTRK